MDRDRTLVQSMLRPPPTDDNDSPATDAGNVEADADSLVGGRVVRLSSICWLDVVVGLRNRFMSMGSTAFERQAGILDDFCSKRGAAWTMGVVLTAATTCRARTATT
jgi:hypothetical protein